MYVFNSFVLIYMYVFNPPPITSPKQTFKLHIACVCISFTTNRNTTVSEAQIEFYMCEFVYFFGICWGGTRSRKMIQILILDTAEQMHRARTGKGQGDKKDRFWSFWDVWDSYQRL